MSQAAKITQISGRGVVVPGDDIDTDRIIPARFLKTITFEGLEDHLFEDDRREAAGQRRVHPVDEPKFQGASVMLVAANFGCGSSREHAPQAIRRWGVRAIVGESFAEIFFGNSMMLGLPCVSVTRPDLERLVAEVDADPTLPVSVDLDAMTVSAGTITVQATMPAAARMALRTGDWDATGLLVDRYEDVEATAARLPYVSRFAAR